MSNHRIRNTNTGRISDKTQRQNPGTATHKTTKRDLTAAANCIIDIIGQAGASQPGLIRTSALLSMNVTDALHHCNFAKTHQNAPKHDALV